MQDLDMSFKDALAWLDQSERFGMNLDLENIRLLLEALGNPHRHYSTIHVTGTNGKGSTSAMLAAILKEADYSVGLYTSPHLISPRERIQSNGINITENDFAQGIQKLRGALTLLEKRQKISPTYFELMTALALNYFRKEKNNIVILEIGMGGRFDSTNIVDSKIQVITNIDLEHTAYLGRTLQEIAREKAGIIKSGSVVITGARAEALEVIQGRCLAQKASLILMGEDIRFKVLEKSLKAQRVNVSTSLEEYPVTLKLLGDHQAENCALAIGAVEAFIQGGHRIQKDAILKGIEKAVWPGRFQVLQERPMLILDAAHNPAGSRVLTHTWKDYFKDQKAHLIFSALKDKAVQSMVSILAPIAEDVTLVQIWNERGLSIEELRNVWCDFLPRRKIVCATVPEICHSMKNASGQETLTLVTGSLYLLGEFLENFNSSV